MNAFESNLYEKITSGGIEMNMKFNITLSSVPSIIVLNNINDTRIMITDKNRRLTITRLLIYRIENIKSIPENAIRIVGLIYLINGISKEY